MSAGVGGGGWGLTAGELLFAGDLVGGFWLVGGCMCVWGDGQVSSQNHYKFPVS